MFNQSPSAVPKIRTTIKCQLNVGKFLFSIFLLATDTFIQNLECYLCMNAQNEFQMFLYFLHFSKEQVNFEKKSLLLLTKFELSSDSHHRNIVGATNNGIK
jgi:hypothetical protein